MRSSHGDSGAPEPGGHGTAAPAGGRDELVIVRADDDFDIDAVFRSENAAAAAPAEASPVEMPVTAAPVVEAPAEPIVPAARDDAGPVVGRPVLVAEARATTPAASMPVPRENAVRFTPESGAHDRNSAALLIADLIDDHVRLEWHEAVAIAQHLCEIMAREPGANMHRSLVEPWNVEITKTGEVQVLPGGSSSDPVVKQVGRVLRVLLQDSTAPAELRLIASQASFDVPVYSSVDELSAALRRFEKPGHAEAIRAAFNRGLDAKLSGPPARERTALLPVIHNAIEPPAQVKRTPVKPAAPARSAPVRKRGSWMSLAGAGAAALVAATAVFMTVRFAGQSGLWSPASPPAPPRQQTPLPGRSLPGLAEPQAVPLPTPPPAAVPQPALPVRAPVAGRASAAASPSRFRSGTATETASVPPPSVARVPDTTPRPPAATGGSVEAAVRRASALLAEGRDSEAAVIFDSVVMKNPLYQLDPSSFTPEALAAFQTSKRALLPAMARRYYQEGKVAYDAGDFSMAATKAERAQALLRDADSDPADADFDNDVANLLALAMVARTLEESKIYTSADRDVTPPRPIGRQLSAASLSGRAPLTGRLELVVGRTGEVEAVKLETPVNGYHDRMIVSAAKAWHYRPALRKGRPVRYDMVMSFTLPDF